MQYNVDFYVNAAKTLVCQNSFNSITNWLRLINRKIYFLKNPVKEGINKFLRNNKER